MKKTPSRYASLDYGLARIGLALSDEQKIIASPFAIIASEKKLEATADKIAKELARLQADKEFILERLIIGMPLMMNGTVGLMADEVKQLAQLLKDQLPACEIILWDERLSSVQADRSLRESQMSRRARSKQVDRVAAAIILQSYLDSLA